jgi:hypothetical protein
MQRIFQGKAMFPVADGTLVGPVLNFYDLNERGLPPEVLPGASIATGEIPAGCASKPHLHPVVTQVTWLLAGALRVRMKDPHVVQPYELTLRSGQAVLTEPMTFLQLVNPHRTRVARLLYLVTPAYIHLPGEGGYDDAVVLEQTWEALIQSGFPLPRVDPDAIRSQRARAQDRVRATKAAQG